MDKKIKNFNSLELFDVSVRYDDNLILDNINFEIKKNEIVALIGKSGVGKTSVIRAINKNVSFSGNIVSAVNRKTIYQEDILFNWLNGFKNILIGVDFLDLPRDEAKRRVAIVSEELGIEKFLNKFPYEMSGGEKKRIAIARAYISSPDLILMDEPFGSLDVFTKEKMYGSLFKIWNDFKNSILLITHDIEEALLLSDRVLILKDKKITNEFKVNFRRPRSNNIKYSKDFTNMRKIISDIFYS
jgi:ABC-type nitrate/sulfonate/bicarbonate transport system ATPase subunit